MTTFRHVTRINVSLWGRRVGTIIESPSRGIFAFRRMVFNVLSGEFDDHTKNFSFRLKQGGEWELAPAYDLTGSDFPSEDPWSAQAGMHQLSVNGKRKDIADADFLAVGDRFAIGTAKDVVAEVRAVMETKDKER